MWINKSEKPPHNSVPSPNHEVSETNFLIIWDPEVRIRVQRQKHEKNIFCINEDSEMKCGASFSCLHCYFEQSLLNF